MNKSNKKHKIKSVHIVKQKPYTVKQENDIVVGKLINWSFILSFPMIGILTWGMSLDIKVCLFIYGTLSLLFAFYNLIGLIFKWDHARVCAKNFLKHTYKFDIRNNWNKEDINDSTSVVVIWGILGVVLLIGSIFH